MVIALLMGSRHTIPSRVIATSGDLNMPAESTSQRRLMGACEHGADFEKCDKIRKSMTHEQMHDFAVTKEAGLPKHVGGKRGFQRLSQKT